MRELLLRGPQLTILNFQLELVNLKLFDQIVGLPTMFGGIFAVRIDECLQRFEQLMSGHSLVQHDSKKPGDHLDPRAMSSETINRDYAVRSMPSPTFSVSVR